MLPADWDDFSNSDRQARELWERVERERETEPIIMTTKGIRVI